MEDHKHHYLSPQLESLIVQAVECFCKTPLKELPPNCEFQGAGVYALYYTGKFQPYASISQANLACSGSLPIYVGKAVPRGWRQSRLVSLGDTAELSGRLREHARSIEQVRSLKLSAFQCRFMVMRGASVDLISTVENALIRKFTPLWNSLVDGFGNHDPGSGRYEQARSEWDVIHPGRIWAEHLKGQRPNAKVVLAKIAAYNSRLKRGTDAI